MPNATIEEAESAKALVREALVQAKYEVGGLTVAYDHYIQDGAVNPNRGMIIAEIYLEDVRGYWPLASLRTVMRNLRKEVPDTPIPFVRFDFIQACTYEC